MPPYNVINKKLIVYKNLRYRTLYIKPEGDINPDEINKQLGDLRNQLFNIIQNSVDTNSLSLVLHPIISEPQHYLLPTSTKYEGIGLTDELVECACESTGIFNRQANNKRQSIEKSIDDYVNSNFVNKNQKFNYMSIGGGRLLQDFIILCRLLLNGFKHIEIELIDPAHFESLSPSVNEFTRLIKQLAKEKNAQCLINVHESVEKFKANNTSLKKFELIVAIDIETFEALFNEFISARSFLAEKSAYYLFFEQSNLVITPNEAYYQNHTITDRTQYPSLIFLDSYFSNNSLNEFSTLRINYLIDFREHSWIQVVLNDLGSCLDNKKISHLHITLQQTTTLEYLGNEIDPKNIEGLLKLLWKGIPQITVDLIPVTALLNHPQDIIISLLHVENEDTAKKSFVELFSKNKLSNIYLALGFKSFGRSCNISIAATQTNTTSVQHHNKPAEISLAEFVKSYLDNSDRKILAQGQYPGSWFVSPSTQPEATLEERVNLLKRIHP